jgi:hypothetical protein
VTTMLTLFILCMIVVYGLSALFPEKNDGPDPYDRKKK